MASYQSRRISKTLKTLGDKITYRPITDRRVTFKTRQCKHLNVRHGESGKTAAIRPAEFTTRGSPTRHLRTMCRIRMFSLRQIDIPSPSLL